MFCKLLRKAGLGPAALKLAKPFIRSADALPSADTAMERLNSVSPAPGNSCLWERSSRQSGDFELDIIIPAYNVEAYIVRCIDSALSQDTKYRFRLIVIDDGSKDGTADIIDSYAHDSRLLIKHQENLGLAGARNTGLELSDSEYIMFLDSDDFLPQGTVEALMSCARESGAAIIEGGFAQCDIGGRVLSTDAHKSGRLDIRRELYGFACMKLFKAEVFDKLRFPLGYLYEDSLMAQIVYPMSEKLGRSAFGVSDCVYNYTVNPAGITASSQAKPKSLDSLYITLQLYKDRKALGLENDQRYYEYILSMLSLSYRRAEAQSEDVKKAMFAVWKDFIEKEFSDFRTENGRNKILEQAVHEGNFKLYSAACKLI